MGAVERDGDVFAQLIDGLTGYSQMGNHFARHHVIEHNDTYVEGRSHQHD